MFAWVRWSSRLLVKAEDLAGENYVLASHPFGSHLERHPGSDEDEEASPT